MAETLSAYDQLAQLAIDDVLYRVDTTGGAVPNDFCVRVPPMVYDAWLKRDGVRRADVSHFDHGQPRYALENGMVMFEVDTSLDITDGYCVVNQ
jgi:hypothetical protein